MRDILKPHLVNERQPTHFGINDIMHTRLSGERQTFYPNNEDTARRLKRLNNNPYVEVGPRRLPEWVGLVGLVFVIAAAWGLILLWANL